MLKPLQRLRGALGMGIAWAAAWAIVGGIPRWVFGFNTDVPLGLVFGVLGFLAGIIFSAVLMLTERRRRFDALSLPRFAAWGAVGGVLLSAVFAKLASLEAGDVMIVAPTLTLACAICASGSLALARGPARRELPDDRGDTPAGSLSNDASRKLPRYGE